MPPKLTAATAMPDAQLWLQFSNGEQRIFSVQPYLRYPAYQPLGDVYVFQKAKVVNGTVRWGTDGEINFDADTLYRESIPAGKEA